jgi:hypothetical protein
LGIFTVHVKVKHPSLRSVAVEPFLHLHSPGPIDQQPPTLHAAAVAVTLCSGGFGRGGIAVVAMAHRLLRRRFRMALAASSDVAWAWAAFLHRAQRSPVAVAAALCGSQQDGLAVAAAAFAVDGQQQQPPRTAVVDGTETVA